MEDTSFFATVLLPIALAAIMFTLGLTLRTADFKRIATQPRGVAIGLTNLLPTCSPTSRAETWPCRSR